MSRHRVAHLDSIGAVNPEWEPAWKSIRHHLGVRSFGVNATVADAGETIVSPHTEAARDDEEVYAVVRGAARFTVDAAEFDASAGTLIRVEPAAFREATALAADTVVLMLGGRAGEAYVPPDWDGGGGEDPEHSGDEPRPGRVDGHRVLRAAEFAAVAGEPLGRRLGVESFGINAVTGGDGVALVDEHDETGTGAEVLYLVAEGDARFTVDGETVDAPAGTFVLVEAGGRRSAESRAGGTLVFAFDGVPGRAYRAAPADAR